MLGNRIILIFCHLEATVEPNIVFLSHNNAAIYNSSINKTADSDAILRTMVQYCGQWCNIADNGAILRTVMQFLDALIYVTYDLGTYNENKVKGWNFPCCAIVDLNLY